MANLTNIIGGQPFYSAANYNSKSLLDFWKGTQAQYDSDTYKRINGVLATAPTAATSLVLTGLTTAASGWDIGDTVYITGTTGNTTRTVAIVSAVPLATALTVTIAAYTSTATTGYTVDKYDPNTLYIITA